MPSRLQVKLLNSVRIFWPDKEAVDLAIQEFVNDLGNRNEVLAVYLCGSWAKGNYTSASDVDLLIVVKENPLPPRERIPGYLPMRFPVSLDLFVYTEAELQENDFARSLLFDGIRIFPNGAINKTLLNCRNPYP